jgi:hypothetical protein
MSIQRTAHAHPVARSPFPFPRVCFAALAALAASVPLTMGCGAMRRSAAQDPLKCERDPDCAKKRGRSVDCSHQCNDNPDCLQRCEQMAVPFR